MTILEKVAECDTCQGAKHLLNMSEGDELQDVLNAMIDVDEKYHLTDDTLYKRNKYETWCKLCNVTDNVTPGNCQDSIFVKGGIPYSFIIDEDDKLLAVGSNGYGELGLGDTVDRNEYTDTGITNVKNVMFDISHSTLVVTNDNRIYVTGKNVYGELGLGHSDNVIEFTELIVSNVKEVILNYGVIIILKNDGTIWTCGYNQSGQLGLGDVVNRNVLTDTGMSNVKEVITNTGSTTVLKNDDTVWSVGFNDYGALGLGDTVSRNTFTYTGMSNVKTLFFNKDVIMNPVSIIIKNDNTVWVTGWNQAGGLGTGNCDDVLSYVKINIDNIKEIKTSLTMPAVVYIITDDGSIHVSGINAGGITGVSNVDLNNNDDYVKTFINSGLNVKNMKKFCPGMFTTYFITNENDFWVAGYNKFGQLGLGNLDESVNLIKHPLENVSDFFVTPSAIYVINEDGDLLSAGGDDDGELGINAISTKNPTLTHTGFNVSSNDTVISCFNTTFLIKDRLLHTAGANYNGQCGVSNFDEVTSFTSTGKYIKNNDVTVRSIELDL